MKCPGEKIRIVIQLFFCSFCYLEIASKHLAILTSYFLVSCFNIFLDKFKTEIFGAKIKLNVMFITRF